MSTAGFSKGKASETIQAEVHLPSKPCLLSLPNEVQDMIFNFAFARSPESKLISREAWQSREKLERMWSSGYAVRDFPEAKVADFMVSKQFLVLASRAYVSSQPVQLEGRTDDAIARGVVAEHLTQLEMTLEAATLNLDTFPNLTKLHVKVDENTLQLNNKLPWMDVLSEEDVEQDVYFGCIAGLRGMRECKVLPQPCEFAITEMQRQVWMSNTRVFEAALKAKVMQPKEKTFVLSNSSSSARCSPLYAGSKVWFGKSTLQDPDLWREMAMWKDFGYETGRLLPDTPKIRKPSSKKPLRDDDIPEDEASLRLLLVNDRGGVVDWIKNAKRRLLESPPENDTC